MTESIQILGLFVLGSVLGVLVNLIVLRLPPALGAQWEAEALEVLGLDPQSVVTAIPGQTRLGTMRQVTTVLLTGVLAAWAGVHFGLGLKLFFPLLLGCGLLTLSLIDHDHQLLPDVLVYPLLWVGLIVNSFDLFTGLHDAVWGVVIGYTLLWLVRRSFRLVIGHHGVGLGDVKLLALLGAWGGWQILPGTVVISTMLAATIGIVLILCGKIERTTPLSFGPYLAVAGWCNLLFMKDWIY